MNETRDHKKQCSHCSHGARPKKPGRETVEFTVKGPIPVGLDEDQLTSSGCSLIVLSFPTPSQVGEIVFRNYYTSRIKILVRSSVSSKTQKNTKECGPWLVAVQEKTLMPHPHLEQGSHDLFSTLSTESEVEWINLTSICLVLCQPSPVWRTFHIEELNVYHDFPRRTSCISNQANSSTSNQEYSIFSLIRQQTLDALKWLPGADGGTQRDNAPGYEFFNLPQV